MQLFEKIIETIKEHKETDSSYVNPRFISELTDLIQNFYPDKLSEADIDLISDYALEMWER